MVYSQVKCTVLKVIRINNYVTFGTNKLKEYRIWRKTVCQIGFSESSFSNGNLQKQISCIYKAKFKLDRAQRDGRRPWKISLCSPWLSHPPLKIRNEGNRIFRMELICFKSWYECLTYFSSGQFLNWLCRFLLCQSKLCSMISQFLNYIITICIQNFNPRVTERLL